MLKSQFVLGRPSNPCLAVEVAEMDAAILERGPRVPERHSALTANDRAPAHTCQALGQETGATHGLTVIDVDQE